MHASKRVWGSLVVTAICFAIALATIVIATRAGSKNPPPQTTAAERDGQHDFDPLFGAWKVHTRRRVHALANSDEWVEFDGLNQYRKIWNGRANIDELEMDSPSGHVEGLTLRTYNPQTRLWSLYWTSSQDAKIFPPNVGQFTGGVGVFYSPATINGKPAYDRYVWSKFDTGSPHFEESLTNDGGKTWELYWISDMTRVDDTAFNSAVPPMSPPPAANSQTQSADRDGNHDFDFELGSWNIHLNDLPDRLAGSKNWIKFDGTSTTQKLWNGRAQIEQFETHGAGGDIEGLTLRTYDPKAHQWYPYWANSKDGVLLVPQIGQFKNDVGEFYAQDMLRGKSVFVRFIWSKTNTPVPHFEQSYTGDGGKTWEVNWITNQERVASNSHQ